MKRNVFTVLGSLLIFLLTSFSASGQLCSYILTGQVTNASTGAIVSGQTVYLLLDSSIWGPNNTITATTSPNGAYHFTVPVACNTVANFILTVQGCGVTTSTNVTATPNAQTYVNNFAICGNPPPCPQGGVSTWYNGGLMIGFTNTNQTAISYSWNMGDGTTYTLPQGNHTYAASGTYTVCHQAVYANNCVYDTCFVVTVTAPVICSVNAVVSASPNTNTVQFIHQDSVAAGVTPVSVFWDMGNGYQTNNYPNGGSYTYPNAGTYTACVTVAYSNGCTATDCQTITVGQNANCNYIVTGTITNGQTNTPAGSQIVVITTSNGFSLTAQTDPNGIYSITIPAPCNTSFTATWATSACGVTITYPLNFTPNTSTLLQNATICGGGNPTDSCYALVTAVNNSGNTINFQWSGNSSIGASVQSVVWDFGNGVTSNNYPNGGTYTYPNSGTYTICATVTFASGCVATACYTVNVGQGCPYIVSGVVTNSQTGLPATSQIVTVNTSFGTYSAQTNPNGYYIITFLGPCNTAFNASIVTSGCGITYSNTLNVTPNSTNYTQNFNVCGGGNPVDSCSAVVTVTNSGNTIAFQWAGNSAQNSSVQSVVWDFGNGVTSNNFPNGGTYTYTTAGIYNVCVIVTYNSGCVATACYTITVGQNTNQSFCGCVTYLAANTGTVANIGCGTAYLVELTNSNTAIIVDSTVITPNGYCFNGNYNGSYTVYAVPCAGVLVNNGVLPTYLGNVLFWNNASTVVSNNYQANCIQLSSAQPSNGPGQISGNIFWGEDKAIGDPVVGVKVLLLDMDANPVAMAVTDDEGFYSFGNLAYGTYRVYPEVPGLITYPILVTVSAENEHFDYANFSLGFGIFTGVEELSITEVQVFPNPASEYIQVAFQAKDAGKMDITVFDLAGRNVYCQNQGVPQGESVLMLDIQTLKPGIYTLRLAQDNHQINHKFIKR